MDRAERKRLLQSIGAFDFWLGRPEPHILFGDVSPDDIRRDDIPVHVWEIEPGDVVSQLQQRVQVIEPLDLGAHYQGFNLTVQSEALPCPLAIGNRLADALDFDLLPCRLGLDHMAEHFYEYGRGHRDAQVT